MQRAYTWSGSTNYYFYFQFYAVFNNIILWVPTVSTVEIINVILLHIIYASRALRLDAGRKKIITTYLPARILLFCKNSGDRDDVLGRLVVPAVRCDLFDAKSKKINEENKYQAPCCARWRAMTTIRTITYDGDFQN